VYRAIVIFGYPLSIFWIRDQAWFASVYARPTMPADPLPRLAVWMMVASMTEPAALLSERPEYAMFAVSPELYSTHTFRNSTNSDLNPSSIKCFHLLLSRGAVTSHRNEGSAASCQFFNTSASAGCIWSAGMACENRNP
jgi:hypothetical protein